MHNYIAGNLTADERMEALAPRLDDSSELLLSCRPDDYSASAIARAVEDCNAQLLGLAVTGMRTDEGLPVIALRVNVRDTSSVERSLLRYGYITFHETSRGESEARRRARQRAAEVLKILEI